MSSAATSLAWDPSIDEAAYPLSFAQERLWLDEQIAGARGGDNVVVAVRLDVAVPPDALQRAVGLLLERQEMLRTRFRVVYGSALQVVARPTAVRLHVEELDDEPQLAHTFEREAARRFSLDGGDSSRLTLLRADRGRAADVLVLTMHPAVCDRSAARLVVEELAGCLTAALTGSAASLPPPGPRFGLHAFRQREAAQAGTLEPRLAHWRTVMGARPSPSLRSQARHVPAATAAFSLDGALRAGIEEVARRAGVEASVIVAIGAAVALGFQSGIREAGLAVETTDADGEPARSIGPFADRLPLRLDLSPERSLPELLAAAGEVWREARAHAVPFEKLAHALAESAGIDERSLDRVLVAHHPPLVEPVAVPGGRLVPLEPARLTTPHDLEVRFESDATGLRGRLVYPRGAMAGTDELGAELPAVLGRLTRAAASRTTRLPDLAGETSGHRPASRRPPVRCFHHPVERQAGRTPDAVAVLSRDQALTYGELDRRAGDLASRLRTHGVGPEVLVGIHVERSIDYVLATLAVAKAGGAFVPLDAALPPERIRAIVADASPQVVITDRARHGALLDGLAPTLDLRAPAADGPEAAVLPTDVPGPASLAYVMYTSGSTGVPNGVAVTHGSVCNLLFEAVERFRMGPRSRVLQFAALGFDASLLEIYAALWAGGSVFVCREEDRLSGPLLTDDLRRHQVTMLVGTPSALQLFDPSALPAVESIAIGGERVSEQAARAWGPGRRVVNCYGPTETTIYTTVHECAPDQVGAPPIGGPIPGAEAHVLDEDLRPVVHGVTGELFVGGACLARGYVGRPALTAARFVPHPTRSGDRLYATGDLVRRLPGGALEYVGRADRQVKVRGVRIELGEVESVLGRHAAVRHAVVLVDQDRAGAGRLLGFAVIGDGEEVGGGELREFLAARLPSAMVPQVVVALRDLPRTAQDKVDREALLALAEREAVTPTWPPPAPLALEAELARLWADVLGVVSVGPDDDVLSIGADSIATVTMANRIQERFGETVPMRVMFQATTVAELAREIATRFPRVAVSLAAGTGTGSIARADPRPAGPAPLSYQQETVWFLNDLLPGNLAYNFQLLIRLRGRLDVPVLERALSEIVRRHEILRTTFAWEDGRPVQTVHEPWPVRLPVHDLAADEEGQRELRLDALVASEVRQSFDVGRLPLIRWVLARLSEHHHVLVDVEHHLVHDGWSVSLWLGEMRELYSAFQAARPSPLPDLSLQYRDYVRWQRDHLQGEALDRRVAYWRKRLEGAPDTLDLPVDRPRGRVRDFSGVTRRVDLPQPLSRAVRDFARRKGATLFATMLTAFIAQVHAYDGHDDVVIGSGVANRQPRAVEPLIGMLVNTLALRYDVSGDPTFETLLARVQQVVFETQEHQDLPFKVMVEALQPERDLSRNPFFQAAFSFHDAPMPDLRMTGLTGEVIGLDNRTAKFDLDVVVVPQAQQRYELDPLAAEDSIGMLWGARSDLFDQETLDRLTGHYRTLLAAAVADPSARLSELPLLTDDERRQLAAWQEAPAPTPHACVHELFDQQARRTPDAPALLHDTGVVTYRELRARTGRLARLLRNRGVRTDVPVGVCVPRSPELVVALLAVLHAGGAFLPLDPQDPPERLAAMLRAAGAPLVITAGGPQRDVRLPVPALELQAGEGGAADEDAAPPPPSSPESLAYVLFTSGSTGTPKGVMVSHDSLAGYLRWVNDELLGGEAVLIPTLSRLTFDASLKQLLGPLLRGAAVWLLAETDVPDPVGLWSAVRGQPAPVALNCVPSLLSALVEAMEAGTAGPPPANLARVLVGGERLSRDLADRVFALFPEVGLRNLYGTSETTVNSSVAHVAPAGDREPGIGVPAAGARFHVLDPAGRELPIGVAGELFIGGPGVCRGYVGDAALTAARFVPDHLSGVPGARLYRTGDVVRRRGDGSHDFLGRADEQVKLRGMRVELGEVEAVLRRHPRVREAVATARTSRSGASLVACAAGDELDPAALRAHCRASLPAHMVPARVIVLPALPRLPNGKVDLVALAAISGENGETGSAFVPPETPAEEVVARIWVDVLGVQRVGRHDDFFDLGGHSLLAIRLTTRVRERFGEDVPLRLVFDEPTLAGFASALATMAAPRRMAQGVPAGDRWTDELLARVDHLTDEEVDALLGQLDAHGQE